MRDTKFEVLDKNLEQVLREICKTNGEFSLLESTMYVLDSLLSWCELCFNNEQEEIDYKMLCQAYEILEKVHKSYKESY